VRGQLIARWRRETRKTIDSWRSMVLYLPLEAGDRSTGA
jgi:hypothetical protein